MITKTKTQNERGNEMRIKINKTIYGVMESRNVEDSKGNAKAMTIYKLKNRDTIKYLSHDLKNDLFYLLGDQKSIVDLTMTFPKLSEVSIGI